MTLAPSRGAGGGGGAPRPLLQDFARNATAVDLNLYYQGALLAPFANRVANGTYTFDGATHHLTRNECDDPATRCGALHGFLFNYSLELRGAAADDRGARLTLGHVFDGVSDPGYPFSVDVEIAYALLPGDAAESSSRGGGRFDVTITATNLDRARANRPAPWSVGWHPYFLVGDVPSASVLLDECTAWHHVEVVPSRRGSVCVEVGSRMPSHPRQGANQPPPPLPCGAPHVECAAGAPSGGTLIPTGAVTPFDQAALAPIGGLANASAASRAGAGAAALPAFWDDEWKAASSRCAGATTARVVAPARGHAAVLWQDGAFRFNQVRSRRWRRVIRTGNLGPSLTVKHTFVCAEHPPSGSSSSPARSPTTAARASCSSPCRAWRTRSTTTTASSPSLRAAAGRARSACESRRRKCERPRILSPMPVIRHVSHAPAPLGGGAATPLARNFWDPRSNQECLPPLYFRDSTPPVTACAHPRG